MNDFPSKNLLIFFGENAIEEQDIPQLIEAAGMIQKENIYIPILSDKTQLNGFYEIMKLYAKDSGAKMNVDMLSLEKFYQEMNDDFNNRIQKDENDINVRLLNLYNKIKNVLVEYVWNKSKTNYHSKEFILLPFHRNVIDEKVPLELLCEYLYYAEKGYISKSELDLFESNFFQKEDIEKEYAQSNKIVDKYIKGTSKNSKDVVYL